MLILATLLLFSRSLGNGFLDYDDPDYVTDNPHVQGGLTWPGVRWALTSGDAANWHPLTWVSHMLDWQLYGGHPAGHHATSVVIHALNAALVFLVLRRLTGAVWAPAFAAALFAWHPLRVESVSWVAERKDVLSVFFGLLTLWAYGAYARERGRGRRGLWAYAGVLGAFGAGLMCKPMLVTVPFVLLLLDVWPLGRILDGRQGSAQPSPVRRAAGLVVEKIPLFLLTAASCCITYRVQKGASAVLENLSFSVRLANAAVSVARYVGVVLWPSKLTIAYALPTHWPALAVAGGVLTGAGLSALAVFQARRRPWIPVGWFWFLGTLVPVLGVVQVGMQAMADRYTYLPSLGLEIAGVWTAAEWAGAGGAARRRVAAWGAAAVLAACAALTWRQQAVWRNPRTLYGHAIAIDSDNYLAQGYLGSYLLAVRNPVAAESYLRRSSVLQPENGQIRFRLGLCLERQRRPGEAAAVYTDLLRERPYFTMAHYRLGVILMDKGELEGAAEHITAALQEMRTADLWMDLGAIQSQRGRLPDAVRAFREALVLEPGSGNANYALAYCLEALGRSEEARGYYLKATQCDPHSTAARSGLDRVERLLGQAGPSAP